MGHIPDRGVKQAFGSPHPTFLKLYSNFVCNRIQRILNTIFTLVLLLLLIDLFFLSRQGKLN